MATLTQLAIGTEVVRSKGDYVVGRIGNVVEIDETKNRVKVSWGTWVSANAVEPTSIPYEITPYAEIKGKHCWPKYKRK